MTTAKDPLAARNAAAGLWAEGVCEYSGVRCPYAAEVSALDDMRRKMSGATEATLPSRLYSKTPCRTQLACQDLQRDPMHMAAQARNTSHAKA